VPAMQQLQPCGEASPWWLAIAAAIVGALCTAIAAMWAYIRTLQRERTKDLQRVIGWQVSGAPPPAPAELLQQPSVVRPRPREPRKPKEPP
jgi:hypothetical protein